MAWKFISKPCDKALLLNMLTEKRPLVSIISVNYNQLAVTCEMLDSLFSLDFQDFEVLLVDNASKENPAAHIARHYPQVRFIRSEDNLGFAGGNNLAIEAARGEYFFFVNNDTLLTNGLMEHLLAAFDTIPKLGVVSPLICYYLPDRPDGDLIQYAGATPVHGLTARNTIIGEQVPDQGQYTQLQPTAYAHGAAMMIPRRVIQEVGPMPAYFFLYYEELDWCEQIRNAGFEIYLEPNAKIYHKESVSVGQLSTLKTYYLTRNRILFMRRNRSAGQQMAFFLFLLFCTLPKWGLTYLLKGQTAHLSAFLKGIGWNLQNPAFPAAEFPASKLNSLYSPSESKL
ncbi:MAG: glycosyltransferase family 2 protein [Bacteroidota bacterium]